MTEAELDVLLSQGLPERDASEFSVRLMDGIARAEARPARILAWVMIALLCVVVAVACVFGAVAAGHAGFGAGNLTIPCALTALVLLLSFAVLQSARE